MPTTYTSLAPVRRVAVGDCSGPLGSGFDALAQSAYDALRRSSWRESSDPPFLPVHDNGQTANKTIPSGDAWKCSYGYNADARTERSACGMVCYTFALPKNATSGSACNIAALSFSIAGDRYLDGGADVYVAYLAQREPPDPATFIAYSSARVATGLCRTDDQAETPNNRHGVTAQVSLTPGVAAVAYVHVMICLTDYLTTRGAWIEGGAMLESGAVSITFSRNVTPDSDAPASGWWASLFRAHFVNPSPAATYSPYIAAFSDWYMYDTAGAAAGANADGYISQLIPALAERRIMHRESMLVCNSNPFANLGDAGVYVVNPSSELAVYNFRACGLALMRPTRTIKGLTFALTDALINRVNGTIRIGFVQGDAAPDPGANLSITDAADTTIDDMIPWRELMAGSGPNLIGYTDRTVASGDDAGGAYTPSVTITREPTKRYLWLCLCFPSTAEHSVKFDLSVSGKWHFDSNVVP